MKTKVIMYKNIYGFNANLPGPGNLTDNSCHALLFYKSEQAGYAACTGALSDFCNATPYSINRSREDKS